MSETLNFDPILDDVHAAVVEAEAWLDYAGQGAEPEDERTVEAVTILVQHARETLEREGRPIGPAAP